MKVKKFRQTEIMKLIRFIFFYIFMYFVVGCEIFQTRTPQEPDDSSNDFQPASTHYILFTNFNNSFSRLNVEYYSDCFLEEIQSNNSNYYFIPDADALARYGVLYSNWSKESEKQFLLGLRSSLPTGAFPVLNWKSQKYEIISTDSSVLIGEYSVKIKKKESEDYYSGIARFVFLRNSNGLWYIKSWTDFRNPIDTFPTWSILKARFAI